MNAKIVMYFVALQIIINQEKRIMWIRIDEDRHPEQVFKNRHNVSTVSLYL